MAVFKVKLLILQGSTFRLRMTYLSGAPATPVDFAGYMARMQIRTEVSSPIVLADLTTENGGITLGGAAGTIDLFLSDTDTTAYTWDSGVYDIEFIAPGGDISRRVAGTVSVSPEVTRA